MVRFLKCRVYREIWKQPIKWTCFPIIPVRDRATSINSTPIHKINALHRPCVLLLIIFDTVLMFYKRCYVNTFHENGRRRFISRQRQETRPNLKAQCRPIRLNVSRAFSPSSVESTTKTTLTFYVTRVYRISNDRLYSRTGNNRIFTV